MGQVIRFVDRLVNLMTGAGTSNDANRYNFHTLNRLTQQQIEASYRSSWLMRNAVDIPAYDMTRAWRDWQAEDAQIEKLEAEERRLGLREKVRRALILGRLGGGALILSLGDDASRALPSKVPTGALKFVHVMSRHQLTLGDIIRDPAAPFFGEPAYFEIASANGSFRIHPSRVIAFKGLQVPDMGMAQQDEAYWGDPVAQAISEAVSNADLAQSGFASLISKARLDIIKMPDLMQNAATAEYEKRFMERMRLANMGASTHQALIIDSLEDWQQRQVNWAGMPDIIKTYLSIVAGATGIPATRLLGKAPDGMNATGEGDERNYNTMVSGRQENELRPLLERLDAVMLPSLGISDPNAVFSFAPLSVLSEKELADIGKTKAETTQIYASTGLLPDRALSKGVQNQLVEDGLYPGLDGALAEIPKDERFPSLSADNDDEDEDVLNPEPRGGDQGTGGNGVPLRRAANDALISFMSAHGIPVNLADQLSALIEGGRSTAEPPFADSRKRGGGHGYSEAEHPRGEGGRWTNKNVVQEHVTRALGSGKEHSTTSLGKVSEANAAKVREQTGIDISGHDRVLQSSDIRHVMRSHGDPDGETARGQVAVKKGDFARIPQIVEEAHTVNAIGKPGARKHQRLEYVAAIEGHEYRYVEELRGDKVVALKSMLKKL
ncbi:anti-CBASS protein Acb1 family protein [Sphingomonas sp.]|uniref:anti-CBASS protein Acb1 family protein n=1 Tax=Sphingomonas sp. TaxID=28214 RepID=UPI003B3BB393